MEIILFLIIGFIIWHFIPDRDPVQAEPRVRRELRAVESDPDWPSYIEEHCESPAEVAFLRAMIEAYDLKPFAGTLIGKGLKLDFQVTEGRYRADFLANRWLVIEVDGAAYHSSAEAIARDKARDKYFEGLGYSVLRLPAKLVFDSPRLAIQRVQNALAVGKQVRPAPLRKSGFQKLGGTISSIAAGTVEILNNIDRYTAIDSALRDAKSAFASEKSAIEIAIELAKLQIEQDDFLSKSSDEIKEVYKNTYSSFLNELNRQKRGTIEKNENSTILCFPESIDLSKAGSYSLDIEKSFKNLCEERSKFFAEKRLIIERDDRLPWLVKENLKKQGFRKYSLLIRDDL